MGRDVGLVQQPDLRRDVDLAFEATSVVPEQGGNFVLPIEQHNAVVTNPTDRRLQNRVALEVPIEIEHLVANEVSRL